MGLVVVVVLVILVLTTVSFPNLVHSLLVLASYKFTWMFLKPFPREVFRVFSKKIFGNRLKNHFSKKKLSEFSRICPFPISFPNLVHSLLVIASYKFTWMFLKAFPIVFFFFFFFFFFQALTYFLLSH